jgi:hypothetical protein
MKYKIGDTFVAKNVDYMRDFVSYKIIDKDPINGYKLSYENSYFQDGWVFETLIDSDIRKGYVELQVEPRQAFYAGYDKPEPIKVCSHLNKKKVLMITSSFYLCESCGLDLGDA